MGEILDGITGAISSVGDWIADGIGGILSSFFYGLFYSIGTGLCWVVSILDQLFSVMSGMTKVRYQGKPHTLIDVFFGNTVVENIYWAMALIGILLCFVFAILAVTKKAADSGDKMRQSMGGILTGMFKGMLIIVCLTVILNMVLSFSDKLLTQINYAFTYSDTLDKEDSITFKDDQYAAMARVLDTIANYSLNPSYNSRYNLNSCFNEIRGDLQYLEQQGVFDFYYVTEGGTNESWQSALQKIVNSTDLKRDLSLDIYNTQVSDALLECMKIMQTDYSFAPLKSYTRQYSGSRANIPLDRVIFLMCTMRAAKNPVYNQNVSVSDPLRGAYYIGEKSIYDYDQVSSDFEISGIDYIVLYLVAFKLIWDLAVIIIDCVARIFNMLFLYLIAPPFIGVMPLDEGGKFKQWTTAFIVQCFGVFGTVIAMRVLLIFIPIVINSDLVLFESSTLNMVGKVVLILGGMSTAKRASGVVTGILADNAGMQAIHAGSMGDSVRQGMSKYTGMAAGAAGTVAKGAVKGAGIVGGAALSGLGAIGRGIASLAGGEKDKGPDGGSGAGAANAGGNRPPSEKVRAQMNRVDSAIRSGQMSIDGHRVTGATDKGIRAIAEMSGQSGLSRATSAAQTKKRMGELIRSGDIQVDTSNGAYGNVPTAGSSSSPVRFDDGSGSESDGGGSGGSIPKAPDISQTSHYDEARDWLPDGDVLTADSFSSPAQPDAAPLKTPPPPRSKQVSEGEDSMPQKSNIGH